MFKVKGEKRGRLNKFRIHKKEIFLDGGIREHLVIKFNFVIAIFKIDEDILFARTYFIKAF